MTNNISISFERQTLRDLLETGKYKTVLLQFYHGLGDAIDFFNNVLPVLEFTFPKVKFAVATHLGQEAIFGEVDTDESHYDLAVRVKFPCSEWEATPETKAEKCLRVEMGLPQRQLDHYLGRIYPSPLIGTHFFSTSSPGLSAPEELAQAVWRAISARGLIPIDTHFVHEGAVHKLTPYSWQNRHVADIEPTPQKLFGLLRSLGGFAGVSSGNFWAALCQLEPEKILYLETEFPATKLTRLPVHSVKSPDDIDAINDWLDDCEK